MPADSNYSIYRGDMSSGAWQMVLTAPHMGPTVLTIAPSAPDTVYALATDSDSTSTYYLGLLGFYGSDQGGQAGTWQERADMSDPNSITRNMLGYWPASPDCTYGNTGLHSGQGGWNLGLAVDPTNSQTIFALGVQPSRSQDGGRTFAGLTNSGHTDFHAYAFDPNYNGRSDQVLYATNDGGVYVSTSASSQTGSKSCNQAFYNFTGSTIINGLQANQMYHGSVTPGGGLYISGSQDTGTHVGSAGSSGVWNLLFGGDGGMSLFDPLDANNIYVEYHGLGFTKTADGGDTTASATYGISEPAANFPFVTYFAFDPGNTLTMYMGGYQLWRSTDGATTWSAAGPSTGAAISAIAVNPMNSAQVLYGDQNGFIYNGTNGASQSATPAGFTWSSAQPRSGYVSRLVFDPSTPGLVYATYATFRGQATDSELYVSTDGGNTWSAPAGSNLPDIPVHVLLVDPDVSSTLYIGTDLGIFVSLDSGVTWANDSSFPAVVTESLQIDKNGVTKYLYAFTYGRGAWRVNLTPGATECTYTVSPLSMTVTAGSGVLNQLTVDTAPGCRWTASALQSEPYLRLQSPAGGVGPGTLYFVAGANNSGATRSLQIYVQDKTINVTQPSLTTSVTAFDTLQTASTFNSLPFFRAGGFNFLTSSPTDPVHSCTGSADLSTGWFGYLANVSQRIDVTAVTGAVPGVITAYSVPSGNTFGPELGCATNVSNVAANPSLQFDVVAGNRYVIEIAGVGQGLGSIGRVTLLIQALPTVSISGGPTQFTAAVSGTPNGAVRWTAQYGRIDANGNYTPPPNLPAGQTFTDTITAISFADSNASASTQVTVQR